MSDRQAHWENVYAPKGENEVSWLQENPDTVDRLNRLRAGRK